MGTDERPEFGTVYLVDMEAGELIETVPDGISIHITGTDIDKVDCVEIRFKEGVNNNGN